MLRLVPCLEGRPASPLGGCVRATLRGLAPRSGPFLSRDTERADGLLEPRFVRLSRRGEPIRANTIDQTAALVQDNSLEVQIGAASFCGQSRQFINWWRMPGDGAASAGLRAWPVPQARHRTVMRQDQRLERHSRHPYSRGSRSSRPLHEIAFAVRAGDAAPHGRRHGRRHGVGKGTEVLTRHRLFFGEKPTRPR